LEDDLLRIFGSDRLSTIMDKLGMEEDEPIEHSMISKAIENAQRKVEGHNFDIRKHLLEYDDVMNKQREVIYSQRREVLVSDNVFEIVSEMMDELIEELSASIVQERIPSEEWNWPPFEERFAELFGITLDRFGANERSGLDWDGLQKKIRAEVDAAYRAQEDRNGIEQMRQLERMILLQVVDALWKEHLLNMDHLKEGIGLRGYGQKNPLDEYKKEGFEMFNGMIGAVRQQTVNNLMQVRIVQEDEVARLEEEQRRRREAELEMMQAFNADQAGAAGGSENQPQCALSLRFRQEIQKVLRQSALKAKKSLTGRGRSGR
jgi:preprotein translocase subunit SecA